MPPDAPNQLVLRDYQDTSRNRFWDGVAKNEHPLLVLPCGAGKTPVGAAILDDCMKWQGRAILVTHVKELALQMLHKLQLINPNLYPSVCSGSLGSHDTDAGIVIGTIQTLVRRIEDLGHRDLVLIDEAHLLGPNPESSYQKLIKGLTEINPKLAVGGMTATPWRLRQGEIFGEGATFSRVVFEISIRELIERGYLVPVTSKDAMDIDLSQVKISRATGDYWEGELEAAFRAVDNVTRSVDDMLARASTRKRVIVFTTGQEHARDVLACLRDRGRKAELVLGTTPQSRRDGIIEDFKRGEFEFLVAVRCLTTGFDCPETDCVVLFTATISPVLYSQMVGRGMRPAEGKKNALVLDYGGNAMRHGPIDNVQPPRKPGERTGDAPTKRCPGCREVVFAGCHFCPECAYAFEFASKLDALDIHAADSDLMNAPVAPPVDVPIAGWEYRIHRKPNKPPVLRIIYQFDLYPEASEWIPFESMDRYGQLKARRWWKERSYFPLPRTVKEAFEIGMAGGLAKPLLAKARFTGKYPEIVAVEVDSKPPITEHNQPKALREFAGPVSEFWARDVEPVGTSEDPF